MYHAYRGRPLEAREIIDNEKPFNFSNEEMETGERKNCLRGTTCRLGWTNILVGTWSMVL